MVAVIRDASRRIARALTVGVGLGVCATGGPPAANGQHAVPTRLWHLPDPGRGAPAADETSAYFLSKSHEVLAVDAATGTVRWRRTTLEDGDALSGAAVLVGGDSVVVGDYNLLAFDRRTGGLRWRFVPADGYGPGVYLGAIADGAALAGSPSGHLYAVDVESGALRWSTRVATDGKTTVFAPAAEGGLVSAGFTEFTAPNGGGVVVVAAGNGRVLWKRRFPAPEDAALGTNWAGGPVFRGDEVIAASGDGRVHAFHVASGELRWTIPKVTGPSPFPMAADRDFRPLALAGELLVAGSLTGQIIAHELATRTERWRFTGHRPWFGRLPHRRRGRCRVCAVREWPAGRARRRRRARALANRRLDVGVPLAACRTRRHPVPRRRRRRHVGCEIPTMTVARPCAAITILLWLAGAGVAAQSPTPAVSAHRPWAGVGLGWGNVTSIRTEGPDVLLGASLEVPLVPAAGVRLAAERIWSSARDHGAVSLRQFSADLMLRRTLAATSTCASQAVVGLGVGAYRFTVESVSLEDPTRLGYQVSAGVDCVSGRVAIGGAFSFRFIGAPEHPAFSSGRVIAPSAALTVRIRF